jgi:hypothetical protein
MARPARRPASTRAPELNKRTFYHLARGFDWPLLSPDRASVLEPEPTEGELRELWRKHGRLILEWAAGERELPDLATGHLCDLTRHPHPNCHPDCRPASQRPWALDQFGDPGAA